jgi:hypothetical protein
VIPARRPILGAFLALAFALAGMGLVAPATVDAASCVRISGGRFDAPGNDNYASSLNGEYIKIKNYCSTRASISGWKLHDYGKKHSYTFRTGASISPGVTVTVYSGTGTETSTKKYWGRTYGAIWNNSPPERAYLRNAAGTLVSSWSPYGTSAPAPASDPYAAARAAGATAICRDGTWSFSQHRSGTCSWHGGVAVWL